jgi:hypothetical protein
MALLTGYTSNSTYKIGRTPVLAVGTATGVKATSITANATFDAATAMISELTPDANYNVTAVNTCEVAGMVKTFKHVGTAYALTIKSSGGTILAVLYPGQTVTIAHNGTAWQALTGQGGYKLAVAVAAGTALTNSTTETVLGSTTLPANLLTSGTVIRFTALARVTANASTTTLTTRVRLGATTLTGTAIYATSAIDTASGDYCLIRGEIVARDVPGATANLIALGEVAVPGTLSMVPWKMNAATFATNGNLLLEVTGQWSAADANSVQLESLTVFVG